MKTPVGGTPLPSRPGGPPKGARSGIGHGTKRQPTAGRTPPRNAAAQGPQMGTSRMQRAQSRAGNLAVTGVTAARAAAGDVTAMAQLGAQAALRVWRSKLLRRATVGSVIALVLLLVSMCSGGGTAEGMAIDAPAAAGMPGTAWAAYRSAGLMRCHSSGVIATDGVPRPGWHSPDMALVMTLGAFESGHGRAVRVNPEYSWRGGVDAFGQHSGPIRSVPLYDPADFHPGIEDDPLVSTILDTDGGRWDGSPWVDHAVGATQLLPSFVAAHGFDGNGDGVIDPHNIFDSVATTAAFFCKGAAAGKTKDELLHAYTNDSDYDALVAEAYPTMHGFAERMPPGTMPAGGPLRWDPSARQRWGSVLGIGTLSDPLLAALFDSVADPAAADGGIGLDPDDIDCGPAMCIWRPASGPADAAAWRQLANMGLAAPVALPSGDAVWVAGALPATGWTVTWPVPSPHDRPTSQLPRPTWPPARNAVALPLPFAPWPSTPRTPPARLLWHMPLDDPRWTQHGDSERWTVDGVEPGADVYSPVAGPASVTGDCAAVTDSFGWTWTLCGIATMAAVEHAATSNGEAHAGQRLGTATSTTISVELSDPSGDDACPADLLGRWASQGLVPGSAFPVRSGQHIAAEVWALLEASVADGVDAADAWAMQRTAFGLQAGLYEACRDQGYASTMRERMAQFLADSANGGPGGVL